MPNKSTTVFVSRQSLQKVQPVLPLLNNNNRKRENVSPIKKWDDETDEFGIDKLG